MKAKFLLFTLSLTFYTTFGQNPYQVTASTKEKKEVNDSSSGFSDQFKYLNIADWYQGMRFMVAPDLAGHNSNINLSPYKSKNPYASRIKQSDYEWKVFTLSKIEERKVSCPKGTCLRTYVVFDSEGRLFEYEYIGSKEEMRRSKIAYIKNLVYLDEVDKAKEELLDTTLFVLTKLWMREDEKGFGVYTTATERFIPVRVTKIGLGNEDAPVKIVFKPDSLEPAFLNIRFSGVNKASGVFGADFDDIFSFENPKDDYTQINNEIWELIKVGKVRVGMTAEECELSWGKPQEKNKTISSDVYTEQWVYKAATCTLKTVDWK